MLNSILLMVFSKSYKATDRGQLRKCRHLEQENFFSPLYTDFSNYKQISCNDIGIGTC
jgi:hypothetical protein